MESSLFLLVQVSFLLFLPALLVVAVWIGNKAILLLGDHLGRLQATFSAMHKQQNDNHELLVAILQKLILQADRHK